MIEDEPEWDIAGLIVVFDNQDNIIGCSNAASFHHALCPTTLLVPGKYRICVFSAHRWLYSGNLYLLNSLLVCLIVSKNKLMTKNLKYINEETG